MVEGTNSQLTERTKKMNSENIKQITNQAIEQLITALNEGRSETLTQYLAAIGRFHRYSLRNVMLIASQKPTATHVAGFHTWHKLGRFVKKGEKGILILAPIIRENEQQNETDESSTAVGFRAAYVFDISQTDGQELPAIGSVNGDPREYRERLGKLSPSKVSLLSIQRTSLQREAPPQEAKSLYYPDSLRLKNSQR
jgi:antirestriction protein ArdC